MIGNPIQVAKIRDHVINPRQELFEEENQKIRGKKGIILKGFMTEHERITKLLEENKFQLEHQIMSSKPSSSSKKQM